MSKFHISNGQATVCRATVRACPLGGEHYDSMQEAAMAAMEQELGGPPSTTPLGERTAAVLEEFAIEERHLSLATSVHGIPREWHREIWEAMNPLYLRGLALNGSHYKQFHEEAA